MEKIYTKPQVEAKNDPCGSYAAGCPVGTRNGNGVVDENGRWYSSCDHCEIAQ